MSGPTYPWYMQGASASLSSETSLLSGTAAQIVVTTSTAQTASLSTALTLPGTLASSGAVTFSSTNIKFTGLPSTDPGTVGGVWVTTSGVVKVSTTT